MAIQHPVDTEGRPIGPLRLRRGMILNVLGGSCINASMAVMAPIHMFATVFMREQLGASRTLVGLNVALWMAAIVMSLPGAYLFNRLRTRRPTWVILMAAGRLFLFVVALAALLSVRADLRPTLVVVVVVANALCHSLSAMPAGGWWSWMADLIPEAIRGRFFGRRYQFNLIANALGSILAAVVLEQVTTGHHLLYFLIFSIAATLGVIDPILFWWVPEPQRPPRPKHTFREILGVYLRPLREPRFAWLVWTQGFNTLLVSMQLPFIVLYQRGDHAEGVDIGCGISLQFLALMNVLLMVTTATVASQWGRLADRIGHRTVFILGRLWVFSFIAYYFMGPDNYIWLLPLQLILQGLISSGVPVAMQNLMIGIAPEAEREYYVSIFHAMIALCGAIGPWLGGMLADAVPVVPGVTMPNGQPMCYLHIMLAILFVGTILNMPLMTRIPDVRGEPLLPWFARMLSGGLFRTAWNISAIAGAGSPSRRIRALRGVRHRDGNIVLNDVAEALEDPDPNVRREALFALGRIGTEEAIELLIWQLHDPDRRTRTVSAEALGMAGSQDGTLPLVSALDDRDNEVRRAAASALGNLADSRSAETLLKLLGHEKDGEVLIGAASALSKLGEFRAVRQMLAMSLENPNRVVRSHIIVAMGDMFGPPGRFYRLWRREQDLPGSMASKLAKRMRRQARAYLKLRHYPPPAGRRRSLLTAIRQGLDRYVEATQTQNYSEALTALRVVAIRFLELRFDYRGNEDHALDFVAAVDPILGQRQWILDYLCRACHTRSAPEAPWDGLTLLSAWAIVHGQAPT